MTQMEIRTFAVEYRADDDGAMKLRGYAAMFDSDSVDMGGVTERIAPGAFRKTLNDGADVRALWNHDTNIVLGRTKAGTLKLSEDKRGLAVEIEPPNTQTVRDLMESIKRGDVDQMSFGFQVVKDRWEYDRKQDRATRTLLEVRLFEVSPVAFAAYPETVISARSADSLMQQKLQELRAAQAEPIDDHSADSQEPTTSESDAEAAQVAELKIEAERLRVEVEIAQAQQIAKRRTNHA